MVAAAALHFMGKLLGVPRGMAPCTTLHAHVTLEGQQMATQLLTAAGASDYMDVCLNTDRMLASLDTSGHDVQT
ncbi:ethanolamine ammonia-lyase subunit EutB [Sorangium sp. So ce176]|uniref:ethanolamine ammonia-lyase subunit EutB n=1 Tax=Sorangium sp. So ce176 TaxID=3133286 RepID=UPI003F63138D